MWGVLSGIAAAFVAVPFLFYLLAFGVLKPILKNHRKAVAYSIDLTTFLLVFSVLNLSSVIWSASVFAFILLACFAAGSIYLIFYIKGKKKFLVLNMVRGFWRVQFILLLIAYFILGIYGVLVRIIQSVV